MSNIRAFHDIVSVCVDRSIMMLLYEYRLTVLSPLLHYENRLSNIDV